MGTMASQITSLTSVYSTVYSGADQKKIQVPVTGEFSAQMPVKWKMFPFDDVIMKLSPIGLESLIVIYQDVLIYVDCGVALTIYMELYLTDSGARLE